MKGSNVYMLDGHLHMSKVQTSDTVRSCTAGLASATAVRVLVLVTAAVAAVVCYLLTASACCTDCWLRQWLGCQMCCGRHLWCAWSPLGR
jgi:hypothetical protein